MNKRRLLKLADLLEADAKNKRGVCFDLHTVGTVHRIPRDGVVKMDCGTAACAMGVAAISGAFKRAGLSYKINDRDINTTIKGRSIRYDKAGMSVFDISMREADFLFTPAQYPRNQTLLGAEGELFVAKRIRNFVAGKVHPETAVSP